MIRQALVAISIISTSLLLITTAHASDMTPQKRWEVDNIVVDSSNKVSPLGGLLSWDDSIINAVRKLRTDGINSFTIERENVSQLNISSETNENEIMDYLFSGANCFEDRHQNGFGEICSEGRRVIIRVPNVYLDSDLTDCLIVFRSFEQDFLGLSSSGFSSYGLIIRSPKSRISRGSKSYIARLSHVNFASVNKFDFNSEEFNNKLMRKAATIKKKLNGGFSDKEGHSVNCGLGQNIFGFEVSSKVIGKDQKLEASLLPAKLKNKGTPKGSIVNNAYATTKKVLITGVFDCGNQNCAIYSNDNSISYMWFPGSKVDRAIQKKCSNKDICTITGTVDPSDNNNILKSIISVKLIKEVAVPPAPVAPESPIFAEQAPDPNKHR